MSRHPEWSGWLRLLGETMDALDDPLWANATLEAGPAGAPAAPLLDGARIALDLARLERWLRRLFRAAELPAPRDAAGLLEAAVVQDGGRLEAHAVACGIPAPTLAPLAQLAATPLLHACRERLEARRAAPWARGYCPTCGAWPALAELRGLERARRLRCGRCGDDWALDVLCCAFCGERDHRRLHALVPEAETETLRVDACDHCRGYLKAVTTLRATPPWAVPLDDLDTVALDVAALENGLRRPERPAFEMRVSVSAPERRRVGWRGRGP